jgi:hypothetical protein
MVHQSENPPLPRSLGRYPYVQFLKGSLHLERLAGIVRRRCGAGCASWGYGRRLELESWRKNDLFSSYGASDIHNPWRF